MIKGEYNNEKENRLRDNKFSLIKKVANSCLFNKIKLVKDEAKHVGQSINNREMIFVENNYINQRNFLKNKNSMDKIKILNKKINNYTNIHDINRNKEDKLYKTPNIKNKKIKIMPEILLKKNSKGILTYVKKIKKPKELLNMININNKNKFINKNQKIKIKSINIKTENSKNYYNFLNTERTRRRNLNKEDEDIEDFNHYQSKYPRLPTLGELQKLRNNNFIKTEKTNYENEI